MGKGWDSAGVSFQSETWAEVYRVLKPGAHLLAFGGTRTYHRIACAIEDAGFEVRDCIMWLYGQGFPKGLDVSKAIDKMQGAEREVVGPKFYAGHDARKKDPGGQTMGEGWRRPWQNDREAMLRRTHETAPASPEAKQWDGWGTALKPAWEPIIVARKPLVGTVAQNVLEYGVGGINIDGCRIPTTDALCGGAYSGGLRPNSAMRCTGEVGGKSSILEAGGPRLEKRDFVQPPGRWPANVILDEEAGQALDEQTAGQLHSPGGQTAGAHLNVADTYNASSIMMGRHNTFRFGDGNEGASRFFYCAKVSSKERGKDNRHPTVKPVALMRYLVKLVTPPDGLVLDPFMGSGSTGIAALAEGFLFQGIEQELEYFNLARQRIYNSLRKPVTQCEKAASCY
jgi:site-specific DNA-methyltransferase (adenine-specific)